jgi:Cysteine-rich secretory protein family
MNLRVVASLLFCCALSPAHAQAISVAEQYLFQAANAERAQRGLPTLRWDAALYRAARLHAQQMASRASISHQYPGEPELADRGKNAGAKFSVIAENVAEAGTAVRIHDAWMNSPGHRENLLDPRVDAVGISVLERDGQLYAVQDFERSVATLSLDDQEKVVARLMLAAGRIKILPESDDARRTCAMSKGYAGPREPNFVTHFTAGDLSRIPDSLVAQIQSGRYLEASVGACALKNGGAFTTYNIAVMLYQSGVRY